MTESSHVHKDGGEHQEDQALDDADKDLEAVEEHGGDQGHEEGHDGDEDFAGEDVAKKTEGKRDDFGELRDQFEEADKGVDGVTKVEELFEVTESEELEAVKLNHGHGDQAEGESGVDVGGRAAQNRDEGGDAIVDGVKADGAGAGQESGPVGGDDKEKEGHDEGEKKAGFLGARDTGDEIE